MGWIGGGGRGGVMHVISRHRLSAFMISWIFLVVAPNGLVYVSVFEQVLEGVNF